MASTCTKLYVRQVFKYPILAPLVQGLHQRLYTKTKSEPVQTDVIDSFTDQLIQKQLQKWDTRKTKTVDFKDDRNCRTSEAAKEKTERSEEKFLREIDQKFKNYITHDDSKAALKLMSQCIEERKCPEIVALNYVLKLYSVKGNKEVIEQIRLLCQDFRPLLLKSNGNFQHYTAEATWVSGNVTKSLQLYKDTYKDNPCLRRTVKLMIKSLIPDLITSGSEANLRNIADFCMFLIEEYNDYYCAIYFWQYCFLSEWFTEQSAAIDLIVNNKGLRNAISNRIPYVVSIALRQNSVDIVYRLLEILLRNEMKTQYLVVLIALFEFQLSSNNLRACSEIVQWCQDHDVQLPNACNAKFINLIVKTDLTRKPQKAPPKIKYHF